MSVDIAFIQTLTSPKELRITKSDLMTANALLKGLFVRKTLYIFVHCSTSNYCETSIA